MAKQRSIRPALATQQRESHATQQAPAVQWRRHYGEVGFSCKPGPMFFNKLLLHIVHPINRLIALVFYLSDFFFQINMVFVREVELGLGLIQLEAA